LLILTGTKQFLKTSVSNKKGDELPPTAVWKKSKVSNGKHDYRRTRDFIIISSFLPKRMIE
jgi:hypothetical protein